MKIHIILTTAVNDRNYISFPDHTNEDQISENVLEFSHLDVSKLKYRLFSEHDNAFISYLLGTYYIHYVICTVYYVLNPLQTIRFNRF